MYIDAQNSKSTTSIPVLQDGNLFVEPEEYLSLSLSLESCTGALTDLYHEGAMSEKGDCTVQYKRIPRRSHQEMDTWER